jgi:hypothetical protein
VSFPPPPSLSRAMFTSCCDLCARSPGHGGSGLDRPLSRVHLTIRLPACVQVRVVAGSVCRPRYSSWNLLCTLCPACPTVMAGTWVTLTRPAGPGAVWTLVVTPCHPRLFLRLWCDPLPPCHHPTPLMPVHLEPPVVGLQEAASSPPLLLPLRLMRIRTLGNASFSHTSCR